MTRVNGVLIFSAKNKKSGGRQHNTSALDRHSFLVFT